MAGVGLILGVAIQIKQSVLFDMLAFLAGFFILTTPNFRDFVPNLRASLKPLILLGVMALVPTLPSSCSIPSWAMGMRGSPPMSRRIRSSTAWIASSHGMRDSEPCRSRRRYGSARS